VSQNLGASEQRVDEQFSVLVALQVKPVTNKRFAGREVF
jgi:hypothetical protein